MDKSCREFYWLAFSIRAIIILLLVASGLVALTRHDYSRAFERFFVAYVILARFGTRSFGAYLVDFDFMRLTLFFGFLICLSAVIASAFWPIRIFAGMVAASIAVYNLMRDRKKREGLQGAEQ